MAMRKTDKPKPNLKPFMGIYAPTPPKPPRPGGASAATPGRTPSRTPTGKRKPRPVVMVKPKGPLTKPTVKNPNAPRGTGSGAGAGSVKVLNKAEAAMKRDKAAGRNRSGQSMNKSKSPNKSYKSTISLMDKANQRVLGTPDRGGMSSYNDLKARDAMMRSAAGGKDSKPKGMTPPKKTSPAPKPKGKGRFGLRGGGGGLFGGGAIRKSK
jgi:hypothetical protein